MASSSGRLKWGDVVLKRGYSAIPQRPTLLAQYLMDVLASSPDGEARVGLLIDQIALSGEAGRKLLEQTRSKEVVHYTITLTNARMGLAERIRGKIGSRLCR